MHSAELLSAEKSVREHCFSLDVTARLGQSPPKAKSKGPEQRQVQGMIWLLRRKERGGVGTRVLTAGWSVKGTGKGCQLRAGPCCSLGEDGHSPQKWCAFPWPSVGPLH